MSIVVFLFIFLCIVLTSTCTKPTTACTRVMRGGQPPTVRFLRLSNRGPDALTFSKIGLYTNMADATSAGSHDWLEKNKSSVQFYTIGLVILNGDAIDMTSAPPQSFERVSQDHYVTLTTNTSLVIDLKAEVPMVAVRIGAINTTTPPEQRRLMVETSTNYTNIADATFTAGFVRWIDGQSNGQVVTVEQSHIGPSGYEYTSTPTGFAKAVQFALPSLARQATRQTARGQPAPAYWQATLANGTSDLFYPWYPVAELTGPCYCYLGAVDQGGQRVLHPNQVPGSPFVKAGLVPASIYVPPGLWVADFPGKNGFFASSGFPINRVMQGDFTLVIKSDGTYPICSFAWRSTPFDPLLDPLKRTSCEQRHSERLRQNFMVSKRRFWKDEQKMKCGFSNEFHGNVAHIEYSHPLKWFENPHYIFCSSFQNLRLGSINFQNLRLGGQNSTSLLRQSHKMMIACRCVCRTHTVMISVSMGHPC